MQRSVKCLAIAATALAALAATAQPGPGNAPAAPGAGAAPARSAGLPLQRADQQFVEHAAQGGMAEVALGRLASERGTHPQVKGFGERMVADHGKANDALKTLAAAKGVAWPQEPDRSHKRDTERLAKLSGAAFDRAYMKHMVDDHQKDVQDFEKASKDAKDAELRAFAGQTLPVLQEHLRLARSTQALLEGAGNDPAAMSSGTGTAPTR